MLKFVPFLLPTVTWVFFVSCTPNGTKTEKAPETQSVSGRARPENNENKGERAEWGEKDKIENASALKNGAKGGWLSAPGQAEIIEVLLRHTNLEISGEQDGCSSVLGEKLSSFTVGRYIAFLLGTMAKHQNPGELNLIEAKCRRAGGFWSCYFGVFLDSGGKSPWKYGLRFHVSSHNLTIDPKSFSCPGLP